METTGTVSVETTGTVSMGGRTYIYMILGATGRARAGWRQACHRGRDLLKPKPYVRESDSFTEYLENHCSTSQLLMREKKQVYRQYVCAVSTILKWLQLGLKKTISNENCHKSVKHCKSLR